MFRLVVLTICFNVLVFIVSAQSTETILAKLGANATIPLPVSPNYRRIVKNADYKDEEHIYRVCNGKNKKTCGFWENVKTKKKVTGSTNYNKKQKALTVKNLKESDFGDYMTGNKKVVKNLHKLIVKG
ncbi:uncharacterized protein CELE_F22D6.15 [Caenorhabditis elegans]|uniref:Secreted protein n=1 Tax=Caenorhabditis elegans TaxID=6239 RepID=Q7YX34_CAEEL|nr:Secreted protein [Caenorhabditis elegans]CAE17793.1 Secreted protein [Caenorhabditis elegans]|eukprot:NP_001021404.1 Uncharacterized protein CELE_F22D6.15 [Caenorhabditis elegans]